MKKMMNLRKRLPGTLLLGLVLMVGLCAKAAVATEMCFKDGMAYSTDIYESLLLEWAAADMYTVDTLPYGTPMGALRDMPLPTDQVIAVHLKDPDNPDGDWEEKHRISSAYYLKCGSYEQVVLRAELRKGVQAEETNLMIATRKWFYRKSPLDSWRVILPDKLCGAYDDDEFGDVFAVMWGRRELNIMAAEYDMNGWQFMSVALADSIGQNADGSVNYRYRDTTPVLTLVVFEPLPDNLAYLPLGGEGSCDPNNYTFALNATHESYHYEWKIKYPYEDGFQVIDTLSDKTVFHYGPASPEEDGTIVRTIVYNACGADSIEAKIQYSEPIGLCDTIFMTWTAGAGEEKPLGVGVSVGESWTAGRETFVVDWGDGTYLSLAYFSAYNDTSFTKTYAEAGSYRVMVYTTAPEVRMVAFSCNGTWEKSNGVSALDVSGCASLRLLYCPFNNVLSSLDVRQNVALEVLNCYNNGLSALDVSQNAALEELYCDKNALSALDVRQNAALKSLGCSDNALIMLDVSQNVALERLGCSDNALIMLDVSQNVALERLGCSDNALSTLDVSQNAALEWLYCDNNALSALDLSQNAALESLSCHNNRLIVDLDADHSMDLDTLPGMDVSRIGSVTGGYIDGTRLFFNAEEVTYRYATHFPGDVSFSVEFTLVAAQPPVTPPDVPEDPTYTVCDTVSLTWTAEAGEEKPLRVGVRVGGSWTAGQETFVVDWGDGTYLYATYYVDYYEDTSFIKAYAEAGSYKVKVYTTAPEVRMERFNCAGTGEKSNGVSALDVSGCAALEFLYCSNNALSTLDVRQNALLRYLSCYKNTLSALDLSQNAALEELICYNNQLIVDLDAGHSLDLDTLPGMDVSRIGSVTGGYIDGTRLFFNAEEVTYWYATGYPGNKRDSYSVEFTLVASTPLVPPVDPDDPNNPDDPGNPGGTTANEAALSAAPFAYVQGRTAYLSDGLGEVEAFTATGQRVYRGFDRSVTLPHPGVYILRVVADGRRCKVAVK